MGTLLGGDRRPAGGLVLEAAVGWARRWLLARSDGRAVRVADPYIWMHAGCLEALAGSRSADGAPEAAGEWSNSSRFAARGDMRGWCVRAALHRAAGEFAADRPRRGAVSQRPAVERSASVGDWPRSMGMLTEDMERAVVGEQRLGFFTTVCEDNGTPGGRGRTATTYVLDDDHLLFHAIRYPQTVANIRRGSAVEVNVVDPFVRQGLPLQGPGDGPRARDGAVRRGVGAAAPGRIEPRRPRPRHRGDQGAGQARPLVSPAYDDGITSEHDVISTHRARFARLHGDG